MGYALANNVTQLSEVTHSKVIDMNLEEFETQYRNRLDETLNQLQTAVLLVTQLEVRLTNVGQDLQILSQTVEEFITRQRSE